MKKISFVVIALISLLGVSSQASAQKIGYISVDQVVGLMPELGRIDTLLQQFQVDSLGTRYDYMRSEFDRKNAANGPDSIKYAPAIRQQMRSEAMVLLQSLQNWQQEAGQEYEAKKNALLEPVYRKVLKAVNEVAKEKGYAYVMGKDNLIVAPQGDDLLLLVAQNLKLKLPAGTGGPAGAPAAPRAGAKQ